MTALSQSIPEAPAPVARMSFEEFMEAPEFNGKHAEWVDGDVYLMAPPSIEHQDILGLLYFLLRNHLFKHPVGKVIMAPVLMKISQTSPGREPDMVFVAHENSSRLGKNQIDGPVDLAVEIISPESRQRDRADKFYEYEAGGVREYWLIDPDRRKTEFYVLGNSGTYDPAGVDGGGWFRSKVVSGFAFKPEWLWMNPPPADEIAQALSM